MTRMQAIIVAVFALLMAIVVVIVWSAPPSDPPKLHCGIEYTTQECQRSLDDLP